MNTIKMCYFFVIVAVLSSLAAADPLPHQTAAKQGSAVLFFATHRGSLRDILYNPIIFDHVVVNQGSGYNPDTGVFTAPLAGIYQFVFAAQVCRGDHNNHWHIMVNGAQKLLCHAQVYGDDTTLNTCYFMVELQKKDQVWIRQNAGSCAWASTISRTINFSGTLLVSNGASMLGGKYSSCPLLGLSPDKNLLTSSSGRSDALSPVAVITLLLCWVLLN